MSKNIIFFAPATNVSGGSESIQQYARALMRTGHSVGIKYLFGKNITPKKFEKYAIPVIDKIEDSENTIIIVPEVYTFLVSELKNAIKIIWWLSVDNYLSQVPETHIKHTLLKYKIPTVLKPIVQIYFKLNRKTKNMFSIYKFQEDQKIKHLYNAEYVKMFLKKNGVKESECMFLTPPISEEYFKYKKKSVKKENIIAYNPAKGIKYLHPIIKSERIKNKNFEFVPIVNMSSDEVARLLERSKLYVDLGDFPGPDRIPRQAVLCGCNILTSNVGAAENSIDLPILSKYKVDRDNKAGIINQVIDMMNNYDRDYKDFNCFRTLITSQKNDFEKRCNDSIDCFLKMVKES